ncbi:hypothetical protein GGX14DRAFT_400883 [Mycena pura]|uniref:Uncharacterized protein n=1 Tax=Mycena pura TaxID=153505 RepID=A0AAD6V8U9_9AGAR|nr:hypothetical protein GGX14DRAFT_400883 [Mycena pura]
MLSRCTVTCRPARTTLHHHSLQQSASCTAHLAAAWVHFGGVLGSGDAQARVSAIPLVPAWTHSYFFRVYVEADADKSGFRGLLAVRVLLFLSFKHRDITHECAAVTGFSAIGDDPCPDTDSESILRGAHLIPVFGEDFLPRRSEYSNSLDSFRAQVFRSGRCSRTFISKYSNQFHRVLEGTEFPKDLLQRPKSFVQSAMPFFQSAKNFSQSANTSERNV